MSKIAWAVYDKTNNHIEYLPVIGNGNQFQYPVFFTKKEAINFMNEEHGYINPRIKKVEIKEA